MTVLLFFFFAISRDTTKHLSQAIREKEISSWQLGLLLQNPASSMFPFFPCTHHWLGWAAFTKHKVALCDQKCHVRLRMKLFESTVTPAVLYGSSCWTMWADTERLLRTSRRRMLRLIVGVRRRPNETWVEYMQRSTWRSEELAAKSKLTDWCDLQRKCKKKQMVQKVKTMQSDRWPARILEWTPWFRTNTTRSQGRPKKRWSDSHNLYFFVHLFF